ncbi:MAG: serine hydrolase, partial [Gammaproteobacteria bacterium]|nr:serine hydrolase [Gammaproteobacteria bacterium]
MDKPRPIASLTKLLTVMTLLDAKLPLDEEIEITRADRDRLKGSRSSLRYGTVLSREELMMIAVAASDNRAASALARTYAGGRAAFIDAMNDRARTLGLEDTRFSDASGLHEDNISTGRDLAKVAYIARRYPLIEQWSTTKRFSVLDRASGAELAFRNTNSLVHRQSWDIELSKTGFTSEAGNCLLMRTTMAGRRVIVVLLNSWGKLSKYGDAGRIRRWLIANERKLAERETHAAWQPAQAGEPLPAAN